MAEAVAYRTDPRRQSPGQIPHHCQSLLSRAFSSNRVFESVLHGVFESVLHGVFENSLRGVFAEAETRPAHMCETPSPHDRIHVASLLACSHGV
jgi:hypothetical protein